MQVGKEIKCVATATAHQVEYLYRFHNLSILVYCILPPPHVL